MGSFFEGLFKAITEFIKWFAIIIIILILLTWFEGDLNTFECAIEMYKNG